MIDVSKIVDKMEPVQYRFKKYKEIVEEGYFLTKYDEKYLLLKQQDDKWHSIHYYIVNYDSQVIGRFDVSNSDLESCGIMYHLIPKYQNRGIGQLVLELVVDDLFKNNVQKILIAAVNERSASIALKNGFVPKVKRVYELELDNYQKMQSDSKKIR